jgi:hypothetical protein
LGSTNAQVYTTGSERNPETMTTRDQIASTALGFNGTCNGQGYNGLNPFSADLNRPAEAWCGDFVTGIHKRAHIPLPSMQPGCRTGFAYCPDAVNGDLPTRVPAVLGGSR